MQKLNIKPKIIFIDLDGTTLDIKKKGKPWVSQQNIDIVQKCIKNNIEVVVSTGRGELPYTYKINERLMLPKTIIFWNGAKIIKEGNVIFEKTISDKLVQKMFSLARKNKMTTIVNSDFHNGSYSESFFYRLVVKLKGGKSKKHENRDKNLKVYKLIFWHFNKNKLASFEKKLSLLLKDEITISFAGSKNDLLEITALECSKGKAEKFYANIQNVNLADCLHFGDTLNDASTIGVVNKMIAMNNSSKDLKNIADIISEFDYKNGGLAKTIEGIIF
ncbi:hypothetical protein MM26B8_04240 [Mycoplasmopsis meleagridis]|uniref:Uncharacterized protein n=1 Tax=Mycoplasmopsis meleagridis ATCC 25294 TaxID=1264554 RepID=A0A0F5H0N9_9BACT|nr:HAD-IIB family hydrolase [Mycoplasmopsis meleagridis]KKB26768.1 hypothetical protein MMELEA_01510 [Mycoplasmopsis meleagridis ATCC 25294]OAD18116.1 hypothetical protein MM26B8_04240 [Mycoplasmopsis meleagridis]VEU77302.1 COF family HAD hydrolase protein [Mycoplasmopsis meleagridis]